MGGSAVMVGLWLGRWLVGRVGVGRVGVGKVR